jgi:hypothetical protein
VGQEGREELPNAQLRGGLSCLAAAHSDVLLPAVMDLCMVSLVEKGCRGMLGDTAIVHN